jgi:glycine reductase
VTVVVHYLNQFFGGIGGEDAAGVGPTLHKGPVGPGRRLESLLGDDFTIAATVVCGDDYAASRPQAGEEILALAKEAGAEVIVAGPAFTSGRYGLACARVVALATKSGLSAIASMNPENPGLGEVGAAIVVAAGAMSRDMENSLQRLARCVAKVAAGEPVGPDDGRIGVVPRRNIIEARTGAERAVDLALLHLLGDKTATEIPLPRSDRIHPAAPIGDLANSTVALLTEGGLVPLGNPDRLESSRATRWERYSIDGLSQLSAGKFVAIDGGYTSAWVDEDPNRLIPLDALRDAEEQGRVGRLHPEYFVTTGNGTSVAVARRIGLEWAGELHAAEVQAVILTAT